MFYYDKNVNGKHTHLEITMDVQSYTKFHTINFIRSVTHLSNKC